MFDRSKKNGSRFTVLLNNMRIMGVFDWLLAVKDYITAEVEDPWKESETVTPSLVPSPLPPPLVIIIFLWYL